MKTPEQIIKLILTANKPADLFVPEAEGGSLSTQYKNLLIHIHPDRCKLTDAAKAAARLGELKALAETGTRFIDDSGAFSYIEFEGKAIFPELPDVQRTAFTNWLTLTSLKDEAAKTFRRYLPTKVEMQGNTRIVHFDTPAVPLIDLTLPQEHVNWIISRVFELISWYSTIGYSSCSILPSTIFVVPSIHGIIHVSPYHMTKIPNRVQSISGTYRHWYPISVFDTKRSSKGIDLYMLKRLAFYLLGDRSGDGARFRKSTTVNQDFVNFMMMSHPSTYEAYVKYREMLRRNFDMKKYHKLII